MTAMAREMPQGLAASHALFLDLDHVLPGAVRAEDAQLLRQLAQKLGGALAVFSAGDVAGLGLACAAGGWLRGPAGEAVKLTARPARYEHWAKIFNRYAEAMPGLVVEEKEFSLVLHYRRAMQHEAELLGLAAQLAGEVDDAALLPGQNALELGPRGGNAAALAGFMAMAPFAGRVPVFMGDDAAAAARAVALGGVGLSLGRNFNGDAQALRRWLQRSLDAA